MQAGAVEHVRAALSARGACSFLADGLRPVARNGWGRHVGAAAAVRAIAKGRDDVNPRNDAWRERLAMCRWRRCTT